jgi:glycosyltransferase involved in cell wall biosynthesis
MGKYLPKFLEWLPKQTFFDKLEVVLDHNEPSEQEIYWVKEFQEKYPGRIKHIIVEKVDPIGTSMNRCIREASGDLVSIWNVDDLRTPHSIEVQARLLLEKPNVDIAYGNFRKVRSFTSTEGELVDCSQVPESELTRSMIIGPFFMFRKSLCTKAGFFDEQLKSGADFDLAIRLAFHGQAQMVKEELGYYLNEGLGASTRPNSLQPIERTVIELRYGIYDKIDYHYLPQALRYNVSLLLQENQWRSIDNFVPNYAGMMSERYKLWFYKGLKNHVCSIKKRRSLIQKGLHKVKSIISRDK